MRRWRKVVMKWDCFLGIQTDISVDDWPEDSLCKPPKEGYFHTIHVIEATSLPDRRWKLEIVVRRVSIGPTTKRKEIAQRLRAAVHDSGQELISLDQNEYDRPLKMFFSLSNGEQFCQTALSLVREILKRFGVQDDRGLYIANFTVKTEETYVWIGASWLPFERWLRSQNGLPDRTSEDIHRGFIKPEVAPL